jgi:hypothetical protein
MIAVAEGFRRLSLFAGGLTAIAWILFVLSGVVGGEFRGDRGLLFALVMVGGPIAFFAPFFFVRALGWVIAGFLGDKRP